MNNKQQRLADKCADLKPLEGRVLVAPNKVRTYKSTGLSSRPVDPDVKEEDIIEGTTEMIMEEVVTDVKYRYQSAVVLMVPEDETRYGVGDTVLFDLAAMQEFDYIKGVSILRKYDVHFVLKA